MHEVGCVSEGSERTCVYARVCMCLCVSVCERARVHVCVSECVGVRARVCARVCVRESL